MSNSPYLTKEQFVEKHPAFTASTIRYLMTNRKSKGLDKCGAILVVGKKLLINEEKFLNWVQSSGDVGV